VGAGRLEGHEGGRNCGSGSKTKTPLGPNSQLHTIVVDVVQPLDDIQLRGDTIKSTVVTLHTGWLSLTMIF